MDASYKIQRGIHVHLIQFFMCPEFWVHITAPLRLILHISPYIEAFWCCPHNLGRFKMSRTFSVLFMPFSFCPGPAAAAPCSTNHGN